MIHLLLLVIYLSFISLGLPDGLLGAAWPVMYPQLQVPVSSAGLIFAIISGGTVISSLLSERLNKALGTGKVTAVSVAMTMAALFGFSASRQYWQLLFWAIPYGLGAGSVDAALNNYVALHFSSRHMSWLHCMWGVGASIGPYVMSHALTAGQGWPMGYRYVGLMQLVLTVVLLLSLPLWRRIASGGAREEKTAPLGLGQVLRIPGAPEIMLAFFCYCAMEQTAGLWAGSYLVLYKGIAEETAARFSSLFFIGMTAGRAVSGFLTMVFDDKTMIRLGQTVTGLALILMLLPLGNSAALAGLVLMGVGCAPVYPCIIHATPEHFGASRSQAMIGVQMASAYLGNCLMPPLFGWLAQRWSTGLFPVFLLALLAVGMVMHERLLRRVTFVSQKHN